MMKKKILRFAMVLCILMGMIVVPAYADYSGTCGDNLTWTYDSNNHSLYIHGTGDMWDFSSDSHAPWYDLKSITYIVGFGSGVTSIGDYAFAGFAGINYSVTIPGNIKRIGNHAFEACTNFNSITIGNGVETIGDYALSGLSMNQITMPDSVVAIGKGSFKGCTNLEVFGCGRLENIGEEAFSGCNRIYNFGISDSVKNIGEYAFRDCNNLHSISVSTNNKNYSSKDGVLYNADQSVLITCPRNHSGSGVFSIPETVTTIEDSAFYYCKNYSTIIIPSSVKSIDSNVFWGSSITSMTIPNSVTNIGEYSFYLCKNLTSVTIPSSVKNIEDSAFSYSGITTVTIPGSVERIGDNAFSYCYDLNSIILNEGIKSIENCAFCSTKISSINIPDSVISVGSGIFTDCNNLTQINVTGNNSKFSSYDGVLFNKDKSLLISYPNGKVGSYSIPDSVTRIEDSAFASCSGLYTVIIPNNVTSIGNAAFSSCSNLTSVEIGNGTEIIGDKAFYYCENLATIVIPNSVISIGNRAFYKCTYLSEITIPNSVEIIGSSAFHNTAWYNMQPEGLVYAGLVAYKYKGNISGNTNIELKDNTKGISGNAFSSLNITSITIPEGVTNIGAAAFFICQDLISISIPETVTFIGNNAFVDCDSLAEIYYGGSPLEWTKILIGTGNDKLATTTMHYGKTSDILTTPYNNNRKTVTLPEGTVLDTGETLNFRNGYVDATNGYVKAGDRKITGSNIYFNNEGKIRLQDGDTAKVEKDNGDGTTDQGFIVGVFNPTGIITMILEVTGAVNEVDYTGRTRTEKFDFTNSEISGLANFGFTVKKIPKPLIFTIKSIE